MKKLILSFALVFVAFSANAEEQTREQALGENCYMSVRFVHGGSGCGSTGPELEVDWEVSNIEYGQYDVVFTFQSFKGDYDERYITEDYNRGYFFNGRFYQNVYSNDDYTVIMDVYDPLGFRTCSRTVRASTY